MLVSAAQVAHTPLACDFLQPPTGGVKNTDHLDTTQFSGGSLGSWHSRGATFTVPADQTYAPVTTTHAVLAFTDGVVKGLLAVRI